MALFPFFVLAAALWSLVATSKTFFDPVRVLRYVFNVSAVVLVLSSLLYCSSL